MYTVIIICEACLSACGLELPMFAPRPQVSSSAHVLGDMDQTYNQIGVYVRFSYSPEQGAGGAVIPGSK